MIAQRAWVQRVVGCLLLAVAAAACWWTWMGWDRPPYEVWQVAGCALSLLAVGALAVRRLPLWIVIPVLPIAFTAAWIATAAAYDPTGLWGVGAILVLAGTFAVTAVVAPLAALVVRPRTPHVTSS